MPSEADSTTQTVHSAYNTGLYNAAGAGMMRYVSTRSCLKPRSYPCRHISTRIAATLDAVLTLDSFGPINGIHQHLCGLHIYAHDPSRAVRAHHYCSHLRPDLHQCVIYDSDQPGARLIGVEYVIPEEAFVKLPEDEKKVRRVISMRIRQGQSCFCTALTEQYWHSHKYEVESGMLVLGTKQLVPSTFLRDSPTSQSAARRTYSLRCADCQTLCRMLQSSQPCWSCTRHMARPYIHGAYPIKPSPAQ
jgi:hypothetical protein